MSTDEKHAKWRVIRKGKEENKKLFMGSIGLLKVE